MEGVLTSSIEKKTIIGTAIGVLLSLSTSCYADIVSEPQVWLGQVAADLCNDVLRGFGGIVSPYLSLIAVIIGVPLMIRFVIWAVKSLAG